MPEKRSKTRSWPRSWAISAAMRVELLGHLGVGLEERLGADEELEAAELLAQLRDARQQDGLAARRALAELVLASPEEAVAPHRVDQRVGVDRALGGDEPHLQLAGPAPLADDEVAQQAALLAPVPRRQPLGARPREHLLADGVGALGGEQAVVHRHDLVPAAGRVEAAHELAAGAVPERVLELVAVAPRLDRGDDRLELEVAQLADPLERLAHLARLDLELALVRQHLPGRAGMVGGRRDAVRRRLEHLDRAGLGVGALGLADRRRARGRPAPRRRRRRRSRRAARRRCRRGRASRRSARAVAARGAGPGGRGHPDQDDTAGLTPMAASATKGV